MFGGHAAVASVRQAAECRCPFLRLLIPAFDLTPEECERLGYGVDQHQEGQPFNSASKTKDIRKLQSALSKD